MPYFNLHEILQALLEKGEYTFGVFIDLSRAFNTPNYRILIEKLQYYGTDSTA